MMGTLLPPLSATPLPCGHGFTGQMSPRGHQAELGWGGADEEPQSPQGKEEKAVGTADLPPQGNCLRQAEIQKAPLPLQLHFFPGCTFGKCPEKD